MFPRRPPFSYPWIGEIVDHRSLDFFPERFLEGTVTIVNEHSLSVSCKSGEERAETELVCCIKVVEGLHAAEEHLCKVAVFLGGFHQVAPLRRQNIDSRPTPLLVLLTNLNSQINQRRNDANGGDHLSDRGKHFPIHEEGLSILTRTDRTAKPLHCPKIAQRFSAGNLGPPRT